MIPAVGRRRAASPFIKWGFQLPPDDARVPPPRRAALNVIFDNANVVVRHRRDWLIDTLAQGGTNLAINRPEDSQMGASLSLHAGEVWKLMHVSTDAIESRHDERRSTADDDILAVAILSGEHFFEQDGRQQRLSKGHIAFFDPARPHRVSCRGSSVVLSLPREKLRLEAPLLLHSQAIWSPPESALGGVAIAATQALRREACRMTVQQFDFAAERCADLVIGALAGSIGQAGQLSQNRSVVLHRMKHFIERHLQDETLNLARIAAAAGVSVRYVNDVFQSDQTSAMRYVWRRRLDNCARDLMSPNWASASVSEIAFRWGFSDSAHFSRAFRKAYGVTPTEWRKTNSG